MKKNISYNDLVEFMMANSSIVFINAYREAFQRRTDIPDLVKNMVFQGGESGRTDIILKHWKAMKNEIGNMELVYWRTKSLFEDSE